MRLIAVLFYFAGIHAALAHIGDTEAQSIQRYGPPATVNHPAPNCDDLTFRHGDFKIEEHFYKGTCVQIVFEKVDQYNLSEVMTDEEEQAILQQNGSKWGPSVYKKIDDDHSETSWYSGDGFQAFYRTDMVSGEVSLTITDSDEPKFEDAITAAEHQQNAAEAAKSTSGL